MTHAVKVHRLYWEFPTVSAKTRVAVRGQASPNACIVAMRLKSAPMVGQINEPVAVSEPVPGGHEVSGDDAGERLTDPEER